MKNIKVLGTGCPGCRTTAKLIAQIAQEMGAEIELQKLEEISDIIDYGVMSTPAVVIDEQIVHAGGIPTRDKIAQWF